MRRKLQIRSDLNKTDWTFWELRTLNLHRVVGLLRQRRQIVEVHDLEGVIRSAVSQNFKRSWWRGLAYGVVAEVPAIPWSPIDLEALIDIRESSKGISQWLVLAANDTRTAVGVHTWMESYLSPVYRDTLQALAAAGYRLTTAIKGKDGLMKLLTAVSEARGIRFPEFRDHP